MEHKIWKSAFGIACATNIWWGLSTIGAGLYYLGSSDWSESAAAFVCLILGAITLPIMVGLTAYLGRQAFK